MCDFRLLVFPSSCVFTCNKTKFIKAVSELAHKWSDRAFGSLEPGVSTSYFESTEQPGNTLVGACTLLPDGLRANAGPAAWRQSELEQVTQPHWLKFLSVKWKIIGSLSALSKAMYWVFFLAPTVRVSYLLIITTGYIQVLYETSFSPFPFVSLRDRSRESDWGEAEGLAHFYGLNCTFPQFIVS